MKRTAAAILSGFFLVAAPGRSAAQLSEPEIRRIDSLFLPWNRPGQPGGTVGIMKDGKVVFSRAYGLASLEYLVPNTPGTRFNIGSVSKQFTAMGVVLLSLQGKIGLDDDVRKYLPELPDFGYEVTIREMIHHTSGLRSLHALLALAGWRHDDYRTNADLYRFMKHQRDLNFKPGDEFLYCNTGYMLLADIIEKITGEKFADWMQSSILDPLGMIHTYVEDDYARVVPDNATSYYGSHNRGFSRAVEYWGYVGSGNIHSTSEDLLKWMNCYSHPPAGWEEAFAMMLDRGILNNGDTLNYAFGINVDQYGGQPRLDHGGSIGGFTSFVQAFPRQDLDIVVLSNFSDSEIGMRSTEIADILLGIKMENHGNAPIGVSDISAVPLATEMKENDCGYYWNEKDRYSRRIYLKEDTLRYSRPESIESKLIPVAQDSFQMAGVNSRIIVAFADLPDGGRRMSVTVGDGDPILFDSYVPPVITRGLLEGYTGKYYSPELDTHYSIYLSGDTLLLGNHPRLGDFVIRVLRKNDLEGQNTPFRTIRVSRDSKGRIRGLYVTNGRVRNLWFEKIR